MFENRRNQGRKPTTTNAGNLNAKTNKIKMNNKKIYNNGFV